MSLETLLPGGKSQDMSLVSKFDPDEEHMERREYVHMP